MNRRAPVPHLPPAGETPGHGSTAEGLPNVQTLREVIDWLAGPLLERDDHARMLLLALLSGEHVLLVGPPGTAKSALARRVHELVGGRWFERLVTRFTVPEELFGPLSLSALDEGRYERQTDAYLPTADVAFLDEVFKANSAILNALLGILNERVFDQGAQRVAVPLACLVAATNELPDDDGMRAFQDRFLFRCDVSPVADASFRTLLTLPHVHDEPPAWRFGRAVTALIDQLIERVSLSDSLIDGLVALRANLKEASVAVSDRRWVRVVRVLRVAALLDGRSQAGVEHLPILRWMLPATPAQVAAFDTWVLHWLGVDRTLDPVWLDRAAQAFAQQLELEQSAGELAFDDSGKLALARQLAGADSSAMGDGAPRLSAFSRARRYSAAHIGARVAQIGAVIDRVDHWLQGADRHARDLAGALRAVVWLSPSFGDRAVETFQGSVERVRAARERLIAVREAFCALPVNEEAAGTGRDRVPDPVDIGSSA